MKDIMLAFFIGFSIALSIDKIVGIYRAIKFNRMIRKVASSALDSEREYVNNEPACERKAQNS